MQVVASLKRREGNGHSPDDVICVLFHGPNARGNADLNSRMRELVLCKQAKVLEQQGPATDKRLDPRAPHLVPLVVLDVMDYVFRVSDYWPDSQATIELQPPLAEPLTVLKQAKTNEHIESEVVHTVGDLKLLDNRVHSRRGINPCPALA